MESLRTIKWSMWILVSAVLTASLMGSLHCVGMCGPLALWASGADRRSSFSQMLMPVALYHFGRLLTYAVVGLLAGAVGQFLDWGGSTLGIQILAARVVGSMMILVGVISVWRLSKSWFRRNGWWLSSNARTRPDVIVAGSGQASAGQVNTEQNDNRQNEVGNGKTPYEPPQPNWITRQLIRFRPVIFDFPVPLRATLVGLLTALLPCGWLYLFALLAAGTGSPFLGALLMSAFWLGSVPALVSLVVSTRLLNTSLRRAVPMVASVLLIVAGTYTASGRGMTHLESPWRVSNSLVEQLQSGESVDGLRAEDVRNGMQQLTSTPLPCCQGKSTPSTIRTTNNSSSIQGTDSE